MMVDNKADCTLLTHCMLPYCTDYGSANTYRQMDTHAHTHTRMYTHTHTHTHRATSRVDAQTVWRERLVRLLNHAMIAKLKSILTKTL